MNRELNQIGTISFKSGMVLVGDPCYINDSEGKADLESMVKELAMGAKEASSSAGNVIQVPTTPATIFTASERDMAVAKLIVSFAGGDIRRHTEIPIGHLNVDSGQMMVSDAIRAVTEYTGREYQDIRIYKNEHTGEILQYKVDFAHYESPIPSQNNLTMNELNAMGIWKQLPPADDQLDFSYNGVCKYSEKYDLGAIIEDYAAISNSGYGDGSYPFLVYKNTSDNIVGFMVDFNEKFEDEEDKDYFEDDE